MHPLFVFDLAAQRHQEAMRQACHQRLVVAARRAGAHPPEDRDRLAGATRPRTRRARARAARSPVGCTDA